MAVNPLQQSIGQRVPIAGKKSRDQIAIDMDTIPIPKMQIAYNSE